MSIHKKSMQKTNMSIDWREVERRLDGARVAIERIWAPTVENTQRILKERAQILAQEAMPVDAATENVEVVEFLLAHERYAIESAYVREVYPLEDITSLPCTPAFVLGIINLHGEILSIIELKKFFDLPEKGITDLNKVIVLEFSDMVFGIVADAISGVRSISRTDIQPPLPTLTGIREDYLLGVTSECVVILDAKKLLTDEKLIVQEQVGS
jgi:purine-binding chemotaxis protein CheW